MAQTTDQIVRSCLSKFLESCGREAPPLSPDTDLLQGLALCSDEGLELVLELCDAFAFNFPNDFNPLVHFSGRRGRKLRELIVEIDTMLIAQEAA